jgi:hypothetical protein
MCSWPFVHLSPRCVDNPCISHQAKGRRTNGYLHLSTLFRAAAVRVAVLNSEVLNCAYCSRQMRWNEVR